MALSTARTGRAMRSRTRCARPSVAMLLVTVLGLLTSGCGTGGTSRVVLERAVPYPLLLVHGFGSGPEAWETSGFVDYLQGKGLRYGGAVRARDVSLPAAAARARTASDFFAIGFGDPYGDLEVWGAELAVVIDHVLLATGASRVVLVAHSAGGVACRKYLVEHPADHRVERLVTVASPHTGTELARLAALKILIDTRPDLAALRPLWRSAEQAAGFPLDAPALSQLQPVEQNPWLQRLNAAPHPQDVAYAAVVVEHSREVPAWRDLEADLRRLARDPVNSTFVNRLLHRLIGVMNSESGRTGDGVVPADRQRLSRVSFFEASGVPVEEHVLRSRTHQDALQRHFEILSAVSGPPRIVEARRQTRPLSRSAYVEVTYRHELGTATAASATRRDREDALENVPVAPPAVVQTEDETLVQVKIGPFGRRSTRRLDLELTPPQGTDVYVLPLESGRDPSGRVSGEQTLSGAGTGRFRLRAVSGIPPNQDASPVPRWRGADVRVTVATSEGQVFESALKPDVTGPEVRFDAPVVTLDVDPLRTRLVIQVWDEDLVTDVVLGTAELEPGRWPRGRVRISTDTDVVVEVDLEWTGEPDRHLLAPVRW